MPAENPGQQKYWFGGQAYAGLNKDSGDTSGTKFWYNGQVLAYKFPEIASSTIPIFVYYFRTMEE